MTVEYCPNCGGILLPMKFEDKVFLACGECDFTRKAKDGEGLTSSEKQNHQEPRGEGAVKEENIYADYEDFTCPKCGYNKAQVLEAGVSYSDEDDLILLKCGKCGTSVRVGKLG